MINNAIRCFLILLAIRNVLTDPLEKQENENRLAKCGARVQSKVYNGQEMDQSAAPWSVFINSHIIDMRKTTVCTGTVISSRHVLTATHCFAEGLGIDGWSTIPNGQWDRANCRNGDYIITDQNVLKNIKFISNGNKVSYGPEKITLLKGCLQLRGVDPAVTKLKYHDIAIIDLYDDLVFTPSLQPACVAEDRSGERVNNTLGYFGFGTNPKIALNPQQDTTGVLRYEPVTVFHINYRDPLVFHFLARNMDGSTIACAGDSGGGSIGTKDGKATVVGVLSQTSCEGQGGTANSTELYSSAGFYQKEICKYTGICPSSDYDNHHRGHKKAVKPIRTTEAPKVIFHNTPKLEPGERIEQDENGEWVIVQENGTSTRFYLFLVAIIFSIMQI